MATAATTLWALATVKSSIGAKTTGKDTLIEQIANGVTALIERKRRRKFVTRTLAEDRDGDGSNLIYLHELPVVTVTSVTIKRTPDGTAEVIASTDYDVHKPTGRIRLRSTTFTRGFANVSIGYDTGYGAQDALSEEVSDVYQAGLDLVKLIFDEVTTGAVAASSINIGPASFLVKPSWPKHVRAMLEGGAPRIA